jgi:hypothetical protein
MSRTTLAVLVILTVALAAWAGDTGLGTSPFTSGDQLTATAVNAMNDAINDNDSRIDAIEAINGIVVCDGARKLHRCSSRHRLPECTGRRSVCRRR